MQPIVLPILDANMTHGIIRAWFKREGDPVRTGEALFEVETDKVNAEVEAEAAGVLRRIVAPVGTRVPVLAVLAFVGAADEPLPEPATWAATPAAALGDAGPAVPADSADRVRPVPPAHPVVETPPEHAEVPSRVAASPAARRLARERGIAIEGLRGSGPRGEVTRADIEAAAAVAPAGSSQMDPSFLALLRRDPAAFRSLSSETKVSLYRQHGAHIGEDVRIESGALIVATSISIGAASSIGADATIECDTLRLGRLVALGKRTRVRCRSVQIGDALWAKDDVMIGGGGSEEPGAHLQAGDACFFGEGAYLNTCHPITLGDEVCIGARAMLFTHSHWQSILRGYPSLFAPIQVGDHVFIGNQAFVFPGVSIGAGATVMVNSFVAVNVPPNTLVGGVPAQVVRHVVPPARAEQVAIVRDRLMADLEAILATRDPHLTRREHGGVLQLDLSDGTSVHFAPTWEEVAPLPDRRVVLLTFAAPPPSLPSHATVFDLAATRVAGRQDALSDEVRELCRRRGIRFRPFAWRHGVGHFEGERFIRRTGRGG